MQFFYPTLNKIHNPKFDYSDGLPPFDFMETKGRMDAVLDGVLKHEKKENIIMVDGLIEKELLYKIHDKSYINFLQDLCESLGADDEYIPSMFRDDLQNAPLKYQGGMYCKEIGSPLVKGSFIAASNSAKTAFEAAQYFLKNNKNVFALTRPPGHHSGIKNFAGYCMINNCFLATDFLMQNGLKPLIVDADYHIGDGTAEHCEKSGVEFFSIHMNPWKCYPYLSKDKVYKPNIHLTNLEPNCTSEEYFRYFSALLDEVNKKDFDVFMLSLGLDTLHTDKCQDKSILLKNEDFFKMATMIKSLNKRLFICLEGGYDQENIGEAIDYFLRGLKA